MCFLSIILDDEFRDVLDAKCHNIGDNGKIINCDFENK